MEYLFDHEKLKAYQQAIQFVAWVTPLIEKLEKAKAVVINLTVRLHRLHSISLKAMPSFR